MTDDIQELWRRSHKFNLIPESLLPYALRNGIIANCISIYLDTDMTIEELLTQLVILLARDVAVLQQELVEARMREHGVFK